MFKAVKETDKLGNAQTHYYLTQGDSCTIRSTPYKNGEMVDVSEVQSCRFKLGNLDHKQEFEKELVLSGDHFVLKLTHEDTKDFDVAQHLYEIEYTMTDGDVQTPHSWKFDITDQISK